MHLIYIIKVASFWKTKNKKKIRMEERKKEKKEVIDLTHHLWPDWMEGFGGKESKGGRVPIL
jgi:hypothetical protein